MNVAKYLQCINGYKYYIIKAYNKFYVNYKHISLIEINK